MTRKPAPNTGQASEKCAVCKGYGDIWVNWHPTPVKCGHCNGTGVARAQDDDGPGDEDPRPRMYYGDGR